MITPLALLGLRKFERFKGLRALSNARLLGGAAAGGVVTLIALAWPKADPPSPPDLGDMTVDELLAYVRDKKDAQELDLRAFDKMLFAEPARHKGRVEELLKAFLESPKIKTLRLGPGLNLLMASSIPIMEAWEKLQRNESVSGDALRYFQLTDTFATQQSPADKGTVERLLALCPQLKYLHVIATEEDEEAIYEMLFDHPQIVAFFLEADAHPVERYIDTQLAASEPLEPLAQEALQKLLCLDTSIFERAPIPELLKLCPNLAFICCDLTQARFDDDAALRALLEWCARPGASSLLEKVFERAQKVEDQPLRRELLRHLYEVYMEIEEVDALKRILPHASELRKVTCNAAQHAELIPLLAGCPKLQHLELEVEEGSECPDLSFLRGRKLRYVRLSGSGLQNADLKGLVGAEIGKLKLVGAPNLTKEGIG